MLKVKDIITLCGSFLAISSIISSIFSLLCGIDYWLTIAAMLIFFSMCTDTLDGYIARRFNQGGNEIGVQIDSLSDCISFVVAPAILMYCAYNGGLLLIPAGIFTVCGVLRLAWFNIEDTTDGYIGLVTPMSAAFLLTYVLGSYYYEQIMIVATDEVLGFYSFFSGYYIFLTNIWTVSILMVSLGILNLADFLRYTKKVRKKRGLWRWYLLIAGISVFSIIILLNIAPIFPSLWIVIFIIAHTWSFLAFYGCIIYVGWGIYTWNKLKRGA